MNRVLVFIDIYILGAASDKFPGFCKCLRFLKYGFATFFNSAGCQKWPSLSASDGRSMTELSLRVGYIVLVDYKDKAYTNFSVKDGCIKVWYLVSEESEEVDMERYREVPILERTGSWSRKHHVVTVAPLPQKESISGIVLCSQSNALYARLLVALKAKKTRVGNSRKSNTTPHPFVIFLRNNKDKGKGWLQ